MKRSLLILSLVLTLIVVFTGMIFAQLPVDVPREDTLMVDQIYRHSVTNNFNVWTPGAGEQPIRQGLFFDTLWYLDQQTGEWINSLAKEKPTYNDDYTEMTVKLRKGIYWSDGVEFTADDVVFTVNTLIDNPGMNWSAQLAMYVDKVEKVDDYTVKFTLKEPYTRFHYLFTVRYNAIYIMPEHVWKDVEDPMKYDFYPGVSLGAYVQKDSDPAGYWELFERRDDWQRTVPGKLTGKAGPKYVLTIYYGPSEKKVMAMSSHQLDLFMNVDCEAFQALLKRDKYARSWYKDFPWAWPDEQDTRLIGFNMEKEPYNNKDVRWALTLALDIVQLQTEYIGGVSRVTPIPQPSTPLHMKMYHKPLEPWLKDFKIDVGDGETFKPYDNQVPSKIADWAKDQGYDVPDDTAGLEKRFGIGWWKHAPEVAEKLLKNNGFTKNSDGQWLLPDGKKWVISIMVPPDEVDCYRLALGVEYQWEDFGIDVELETLERSPFSTRQQLGDFSVVSSWGFTANTSNAIDDKWQYLQPLHSDFYKPSGEVATNNWLRIKSKDIDKIIKQLGALAPGDPKIRDLEYDFFKNWVANQYDITTVSFKKFITQDEYYWTNFPTSEDPYGQPCYWFMGYRFILPYLQKAER